MADEDTVYNMTLLANEHGRVKVRIDSAPYEGWINREFWILKGREGAKNVVLSEPDERGVFQYSPEKLTKYFERNPQSISKAIEGVRERNENKLGDLMTEEPGDKASSDTDVIKL